jgi:hypothetical protein
MSESKNGEALKYIRTVVSTATAAGFTARNPTLLKGQLGYETDTKKLKVGTGSTVWTSLPYVTLGGVAIPASHTHPVADISDATDVGVEFMTITTPAGVRFARINADGTITLRTAAELAIDIGAAGVSDGDKGDIIVSSGGTVWTVDDSALPLTKLADIGGGRIIGRQDGAGIGEPVEMTADEVSTILDTAADPFLRTSAAGGSTRSYFPGGWG